MPDNTHAHELIAKTARGMAEAVFEEFMKDNGRYKAWQDLCPELTQQGLRQMFVMELAPKLVPKAKEVLAGMLGRADVAEVLKMQIMDALVLDNALRVMGPGKMELH